MKIVKRGLLSIVAALVLLFLWATFPWQLAPRSEEGEIGQVTSTEAVDDRPTTLTVMTWNIAYGYGMNSEGTSAYVPYGEEKYRQHMSGIAETIRASQADVVLLQEIDFNSSRSHGQDQLKYLAEQTGLKHWAKAVSWRANYIPFPSWPVSLHFGKMNSGGAVLSRWPIKANHIELLQKPTNKAWWYNLFYLFRYFQTVDIQVGERTVKLTNLHLEAFHTETKAQQVTQLVELAAKLRPDFIGGDFNTVPDGAMKRSGFSNPADRYESDPSFSIMAKLPYKEVVDLAAYLRREELWFSFPSNRPDRRLDYIFFAGNWVLMQAEVVNGAHAEVSDHLPVKATFKFFEPVFIRD